jgi:hypothetical protein
LVPAAAIERFRRDCRAWETPPYSAYLAAAAGALAAVGGPQGPGFGINIISSSRSWPGSAGLIGLFSNYVTVGLGPVPADRGSAAGHVHGRLTEALRHDLVPRAEILRRFCSPGMRLPTGPCVLFDLRPDLGGWAVELDGAVLRQGSVVRATRAIRRFPGIFLTAEPAGADGVLLSCEYGEGEWQPEKAGALVDVWAGIIAGREAEPEVVEK